MREHHNSANQSLPAHKGGRFRICPVCERGFAGAPARQRCCSTRCAMQWKRSQRQRVAKPPRFDVIEGRPSADPEFETDDIEAEWRERGAYWQSIVESLPTKRRGSTLSCAGHGTLIRVDGNSLVMRQGFTHHPQPYREPRYTPRSRDLPERIVLLACDGAVTVTAMNWLARNNIPLLLLDYRGNLDGTLCAPNALPYDARLNSILRDLKESNKLIFSRDLVDKKLEGQLRVLESFASNVARLYAMERIRKSRASLECARSIDDVRLCEARAAAAYFKMWMELPIQWKRIGSRPVPAEWLTIGVRSSVVGATNRHSEHPVNSMLNYAYAILQSQVAIATAAEGIDSELSALHSRREGRPALVFDLMEPLRPLIDGALLGFLRSHGFSRSDFPIGSDGVVRLHPQLARVVASSHALDQSLVSQTVARFKRQVSELSST